MNTMSTEQLEQRAKEFRYVITDMICRAGSGHLGGSLSLVEIVTTLYYRIMNIKPENPAWEDRDRLVLSKGHAGPVLYVVLAYLGFFPKSWLKTLNQNGTNLPSHVDHNKTPGIDMTAGSLGQGLSCACGMAYAAKLNKKSYNVFCIIGDGESNEGQIWEAAMFAGHNKLDNLIVICDYNKMQIDGKTDEVVTLEPLADKWRAFNFEVFEMDGHNWDDIYSTINKAISVKGKPAMIIAHTIKGKGNAEVENKVASHNIKINNQSDYDKYMKGLGYTMTLPY
ncbi:MAG TPA: transketolase [Spirochaetota bacterium]|nr:transketolase [Spirochaetota bacterium]HOM09703.1 transketolase [Spirochaetota bacterium]HPP49458.1 transketolase [Spirochaetota bacterium]HXK65266.1 transketolase [Spirochaetota bacterium]